MAEIALLEQKESSGRDYSLRKGSNREELIRVASQYGAEYWDGDRAVGYGGYHYDGRWAGLASAVLERYGNTPIQSVLDVGCAKGFLLYEFLQADPSLSVAGIDISQYAIDNAHEQIANHVRQGSAAELPYDTDSFDVVVSNSVLHNLPRPALDDALREIVRVGRGRCWISVVSFRNAEERERAEAWAITCQSLLGPDEWRELFAEVGYDGDYQFQYFT